eukprot:gene6823-biopygen7592
MADTITTYTTMTPINATEYSSTISANTGSSTAANAKMTTTIAQDEFGTLQVHVPNESVPVAINNIGVFQTMSMMIQCMQTPCPPHHYRTGCEELMSAGQCTPCSPCCDRQYQSGCGGASEGLCLNVTNCGPGEFEVRAPTPTSDRFCVAPLCSVNEYEIVPVTTSTSRKCAVLNESTITSDHICEVARVDNCCCDEFSSLIRVRGDVNIRSDETMLHFGRIQEVGGNINGRGPSSSNRGSLQVVDFGQVTRVGGDVDVTANQITRVEFGTLTRLDGFLWYHRNDLTSIDFGTITQISSSLRVYNNVLTSINFGAITQISGSLSLHNNGMTSIDFGTIIHISGDLRVYNNPSLSSIDCRNLGLCLCRSSYMTRINCPDLCTKIFCD